MNFEIATWYATWNHTGLDNLVRHQVPLGYATRYNLAFGIFVAGPNGHTMEMNAPYYAEVLAQIRAQDTGAVIYGGISDDIDIEGIATIVHDNSQNHNRATANIVAYLQEQGLKGINIDAEKSSGMRNVAQLVAQLGPSFKAAGLGIAVSAPWPGEGPAQLFGEDAVAAFNQHVDVIELQDYSSPGGTPVNAKVWLDAGVKASILMGGICTENSDVQTPVDEIAAWTEFAMQNRLRGMFSWRLDNDHGFQGKGEGEDVGPRFTGAKALFNAVKGNIR